MAFGRIHISAMKSILNLSPCDGAEERFIVSFRWTTPEMDSVTHRSTSSIVCFGANGVVDNTMGREMVFAIYSAAGIGNHLFFTPASSDHLPEPYAEAQHVTNHVHWRLHHETSLDETPAKTRF